MDNSAIEEILFQVSQSISSNRLNQPEKVRHLEKAQTQVEAEMNNPRGCDREEWRLIPIEDSASQGSGSRLDCGEFGTLLDPCSKFCGPRLAEDQNPISVGGSRDPVEHGSAESQG